MYFHTKGLTFLVKAVSLNMHSFEKEKTELENLQFSLLGVHHCKSLDAGSI